jgi:long-chain fatty acid transport protein
VANPRFRCFRIHFLWVACAAILVASPVLPAGFGFFEQGAKATAMGGAFGAVADDPSAIFYNPSGIGFQDHFSVMAGTTLTTFTKSQFTGDNPAPGDGVTGTYHKTWFFPSQLYIVAPITSNLKFGFGVFSPFGLAVRWKNPETWAGRFISQNTAIKTFSLEPVLAYRVAPSFSIAAGAEYRISNVTIERNEAKFNPFSNSFVDVAHIKLKSDNAHAWGWNAGFLWKPAPMFSLGVSYRSHMKTDFDARASFTQRPSGNPVFDAIVASRLPSNPKATTSIDTPAIADFGAAYHCASNTFTLSADAVWTEWSRFSSLAIIFPNGDAPSIPVRNTGWKNAWSYRVGVEQKFRAWALRAGFVYDQTPQPDSDVGPILPDSNRHGYCLGFGYNGDHFGVDLADMYLPFQDRSTHGNSNSLDTFNGTYKLTANLIGVNVRLSF